MDNRELEKEELIPEEPVKAEAAEESVPDAEPEIYDDLDGAPKKKKKEKKVKNKDDEPSKGPKKAIIICVIIALIVVILGTVAAGVLWYLGSTPDSDVLPPEQQEEMPDLEDGTKFY